ncbi:MAG: hypothetical protein ACOY3E_14765 [Pseudomonadota bacterium]
MYRLYDVVRIASGDQSQIVLDDASSIRMPVVDDIATVLLVHEFPPAYELECLDKDGNTVWVATVPHSSVEIAKKEE